MESAGEFELDLRSIVEWGDRWLRTFNATKTKQLSFNPHRDPLLVPVEMNGIELPQETSFRLLGLTFTQSMDWKPYIRSIDKAASRKVGNLYRAQCFLTPESILYLYKSTIQPCMNYCSHIWGGAPRSNGLDLLDNVQKLGSQLSRCWTFFWFASPVTQDGCYYEKCSSELSDLVMPEHVTVRSTRFSEQMHHQFCNMHD